MEKKRATLKIKLKNGDSYIVKSDKISIEENVKSLFGENKDYTFSTWELQNSIVDSKCFKTEFVAIVGDAVSSIEYAGANNE